MPGRHFISHLIHILKSVSYTCMYRYVALREILMYHVGFEAINDVIEDTIRYASFESLLIDQVVVNEEDAERNQSNEQDNRPLFTIPNYRGRNTFPINVMNAAEKVLKSQLRGGNRLHPLSLSPSAVRALYGASVVTQSYCIITILIIHTYNIIVCY